jgi:site-specific recombinase XerD
MSQAEVVPITTLLPTLAPDLNRAAELAREEKAPATRRAYRSDFRIFEEWCHSRAVSALPGTPETVAAFLAHDLEQGTRASTLGRRVASIRYAHKLAGYATPTDNEWVKATMRGIRRSVGTAPRKKSPATAERVIAMTIAAGTDLKGLRDRALLLFGFAGAFRPLRARGSRLCRPRIVVRRMLIVTYSPKHTFALANR